MTGRAGTASSSATTPTPPPATPPCAIRSCVASRPASPAPTRCRPASGPSSPADSRPRRRSTGSCVPPPAGCCASTGRPSRAEANFDGKFLLRTSDESLTAADIAQGYKGLYEAERGWRDLKSSIDLRPVYHHREDRIRAHIQIQWLALLLLRVAETTVGDTWRNIRDELERMHLVTLATTDGHVAQRSELTAGHRSILRALDLPEPPRFIDFTPAAE